MSQTADQSPVLFQQQGAIALLTLNRPDTRNALSGEAMFSAFETLFARLNADMSIRAAILTGAGSAFCSGGNVAEMRDRQGMFAGSPAQIASNYRVGIQRIPRAFQRLRVPIIAAVNGAAVGAGNDLACMCDIRIASTHARFAESFVKVGIVPGDGGCWLLPRVIGASRAAELALTGDTIDAEEALRIGLVSRIVAPEQLLYEAFALGSRIAANPPQVLRWTKQLLQQARQGSLDEALDAAGHFQGLAHHTADHAEALAAFFEKRPPVFGCEAQETALVNDASAPHPRVGPSDVLAVPGAGTALLEERPADGVALLRLHRLAVLNALNLALRRALAEAFTRLDADDSVRVVVLAGGERAFCAGADLNEYVDASSEEIAERRMDRLWGAIAACRKPVIAAVRGHALGGGCELAMHADIIVAGDSARFGQPEVLVGIMPGGGATQRLTHAIGKFRAMQLLLTGAPFSAAQALAIGLASEVVADAAVDSRALELAVQLAAGPQQALQAIKRAVLQGMNLSLDDGLAFERTCFQSLFASADKTEGMRARLDKRAARFASIHPEELP